MTVDAEDLWMQLDLIAFEAAFVDALDALQVPQHSLQEFEALDPELREAVEAEMLIIRPPPTPSPTATVEVAEIVVHTTESDPTHGSRIQASEDWEPPPRFF